MSYDNYPVARDWSGEGWTLWAIDRGTVYAALSFCLTVTV